MKKDKLCMWLGIVGGIMLSIGGFLGYVLNMLFDSVSGDSAGSSVKIVLIPYDVNSFALSIIFGIAVIIFSVLSAKRNWSRICMIVLGAFCILFLRTFYVFLVSALIIAGGIVGLVRGRKNSAVKSNEHAQSESEQVASENAVASAMPEVEKEGTAVNGKRKQNKGKFGTIANFKAKFIKEESSVGKTKTFVVLTIFYAALLVLALVIGLAQLGGKDVSYIAIAYAMLTPSYFIYLGSHKPFGMKDKLGLFFVISGIVLLVACAGVAIFLIMSYYSQQLNSVLGILISFALVVADAGYIFAYAYWCKGLSSAWYMGIGILGTILFPLAAMLVIILFILRIVIFFVGGFFSLAKTGVSGNGFVEGFKAGYTGRELPEEYIEIHDGGYTRLLKYRSRDYVKSRDIYIDDLGCEWYSQDGGETFYKEN